MVAEEVLLEDRQDHRSVDDEAEDLAEAEVEDLHEEAGEGDLQDSTSTSHDLSIRP